MTTSIRRQLSLLGFVGLLAGSARAAEAKPVGLDLLGRNLLANANAEAGSPAQIAIPGWGKEGAVQIAAYADYLDWADLPPDRGNRFYWGGGYAKVTRTPILMCGAAQT